MCCVFGWFAAHGIELARMAIRSYIIIPMIVVLVIPMISVSLAACAGSHDAALGEGYVLGVTVVGNGHNTILLPFQGNYRRSKPYRTSKTPNLSELKFCRWNRSKQKVSRRNQQLYRSRMIYLQVMLSSHRKVRTLPSSCEEKQQKTKKCN